MNNKLFDLDDSTGGIYKNFEFLLRFFQEVLIENNEPELAKQVPWVNNIDTLNNSSKNPRFLQVYSISFQLLNLYETNMSVHRRRAILLEKNQGKNFGLWSYTLAEYKKKGYSEQALVNIFSKINIEPVLTAHPTEAKRPIILALFRELYLLIEQLEDSVFNSIYWDETKYAIKQILHKLFYIEEIYQEKPTVEGELDNILNYFYKVFPKAIPILDLKLQRAWVNAGYDPKYISNVDNLPQLRFGNWVGGDRDGHPLVTADTTKHTLYTFRLNGVKCVYEMLGNLSDKLSIYTNSSRLIPEFTTRLKALQAESKKTTLLYPDQLFRTFVELLKSKMPIEETYAGNFELLKTKITYNNSYLLVNDLNLLKTTIEQYGAISVAQHELNPLLRHLQVFGFHLARVDIRQNSAYYEEVMLDMVSSISEERCLAYKNSRTAYEEFLAKELLLNQPMLSLFGRYSDKTNDLLQLFKEVSDFSKEYGYNGLGSVIISMTRNVYDMYTVLLLMREAGLVVKSEKGYLYPLPLVPLFETIEDLNNSYEILETYLSHPVVKNSLAYIQEANNLEAPVLEVMIGYSDSNKDGGIFASAWNLYKTENKLTKLGNKHGIIIKFFHGKGGTISRGAGPIHYFLDALPKGSLSGMIRLTEQGESIEKKYATVENAAFNLELLMAGTVLQTKLNTQQNKKEEETLAAIFNFLETESFKSFRKLTRNPLFLQFFEEATPIDVIEKGKIGSRPSRRSGKRTLGDLRAIPWVFSWTQSRMLISSWYGVGSSVTKLKLLHPDLYTEFKALTKTNSFVRYLLTNIDSSIATTSEEIIGLYSGLVKNEKVKAEISELIVKELKKTHQVMGELLGSPLSERRKLYHYSLLLRNDALKLLHQEQVRLLNSWRNSNPKKNPEEHENMLRQLQISINAISNAMGSTG